MVSGQRDPGADNITGRILAVDDDGVTLVPEIAVKKGMKPKQGDPVKLPFDTIRSGKVEIEFSQPRRGRSGI